MIEFSRVARGKWFWPTAIAGGVLVVALAAPFLVPLRGFIPELAETASMRIGRPVSVEDMRLEILPTPRVALYGIKVGKGAPLAIDELRVVPEFTSLLGEHKVIRLVRADGVRIRESALRILNSMPKPKEGGAAARVARVELRNVTFTHRFLKVPPFDARIELGPGYAPESAVLTTVDQAFEARLDPQGDGAARVALEAHGWRLPVRVAPLMFESLEAKGTLQGGRLELPEVEGSLYGGTLSGSFQLDWSRGWRLDGNADIAQVELVPLLRDLGKPARLSGLLDAQAVFSSRAKGAAQLGYAFVLDGPAAVKGGSWHGVDLARAAELPLGKPPADGETPFEELSAKVALRGKAIRLEEICARSPSLVAGGSAEIAPDGALSGLLDVSVAKTGGIVGVPLALGGTLSEPSVGLTRGAAIGALLGTLLLPGVGTTLGATAVAKLESVPGCK